MKERYNIQIADIQLTILSDEPKDFVLSTVAMLDERVSNLIVQNKRCSKLDAAMLCALDFLGEKRKAEKKIRNLEAQVSLYEARLKMSAPDRETAPVQVPLDAEAIPAEKPAEAPDAAAETEAAPQTPADETSAEAQPGEAKAEEAPAEETKAEAPHDAKLRQIENLLRRRSESPAAAPSPRDDKLRQIEDLLRQNGSQSLREALSDAASH